MSTLAMPLIRTAIPRLPQSCGRAGAASISLGLHALAVVVLAGVWHVDKPAAPPPAAISARLVIAPQPTVAATPEPSPPAPAAPPRAAAPPLAAQRTPVRRTATPVQPPAVLPPQAIVPQASATESTESASDATESAPSLPTSAAPSNLTQGVASAQSSDTASTASRPHLPIEKETPDYPQRALDTDLEGDCTLEYAVTPEGRTENPRVVGDCHPLFIRPSLQAARGFRYEPRIVDGKAVTVPAVRNTFHFRIER